MEDVLISIMEKPNWDRMVAVMQEFNEEEQQGIYSMVMGARAIKRIEKEREEDGHSA